MAAAKGTKLKDHKVLALDIGTRFIKVAELKLAKGMISLVRLAVAPTSPDLLDKSTILDPVGLGKEIKRIIAQNKFATRKVVLAVRGQSSVVVRPIDLPKMSQKELVDTMKFEVERHVPFSANEIVMDYAPFVDPAELPETEENMKVLLAVAQEELINVYLKMLKTAGLSPVALDIEILAAIRAILDIHQDEGAYEQTVALINLGSSSTDISIVSKGNLVFNRSVPIAGDALTGAVGEQLGRTFEEAEELKKAHGCVFLETAVGELPVPQDEPPMGDADDMPFFSFGQSGASTEATMAWTNDGPVPQQVFSLGDNFGASTPEPPAPASEPDTTPAFSLDDEDGKPFFTFETDEPAEATAAAAPADNGGLVFDLSSELEEQLPPQRSRPAYNMDADEEPALAVNPAMMQPEGQLTPDGESVQPDQQIDADSEQMAVGNVTALGDTPLVSMTPTETPPAQNDAFQRRVFECMQPTLVELATEIRRSLEFFATRDPEDPVQRIILYGGTSRLPKMAEFLQQEIGLDVIHADPLQAVDTTLCQLPSEYLQELAPVLPICIGLGLRDMLA